MAKFKKGDKVKVGRDIVTIVREEGDDDPSIPGEMIYLVRFMNRPGFATVAESEIKSANSCRSTNAVVAKALNACGTARNSATVTIGAGVAARVQHAMRDIARGYGARIIGSNVLACSDEDEAEEIVELLKKEYKVPDDEVWINAKRVVRNASEYENYKRFVKKYENEIKRIVATLKNFYRECPDGATIETEASRVADGAENILRWLSETKMMGPEDFA